MEGHGTVISVGPSGAQRGDRVLYAAHRPAPSCGGRLRSGVDYCRLRRALRTTAPASRRGAPRRTFAQAGGREQSLEPCSVAGDVRADVQLPVAVRAERDGVPRRVLPAL